MNTCLMLRVLLASVLLCTALASVSDEGAAASKARCEADNTLISVCTDCQTVFTCGVAGAVGEEKTCDLKTLACEEDSGTNEATCTALDSLTDDKALVCSCTVETAKVNGQVCDPYDSKSFLFCVSEAVAVAAPCTEDEVCLAAEGAPPATDTCGVAPVTEPPTTLEPTTPAPKVPSCPSATGGPYAAISADCATYSLCNGAVPVLDPLNCKTGSYFDEVAQGCYQPVPCLACGDGLCGNPTNCSLYEFCQGGEVTAPASCQGETPYFDYEASKCSDDASKCHPSTLCAYPDLPTTAPSSDATVEPTTGPVLKPTTEKPTAETTGGTTDETAGGTTGGATEPLTEPTNVTTKGPVTTPAASLCTAETAFMLWEDPDNCRMYYQCVPEQDGTYSMIQGTCYGSLVFNPETRKCDLAENVPSCP